MPRVIRDRVPAVGPARLLNVLVDHVILDLDATGIPGQAEREIIVRFLALFSHFYAIPGTQPAVAEIAPDLETGAILQAEVHHIRLLRDGSSRESRFPDGRMEVRRKADERPVRAGRPPERDLVHIGRIQLRAGRGEQMEPLPGHPHDPGRRALLRPDFQLLRPQKRGGTQEKDAEQQYELLIHNTQR